MPVGMTTAVASPGIGIGRTSGMANTIKEAGIDLGPSPLTISSIVNDFRESSSSNRRRISEVRGALFARVLVLDRTAERFCLVAGLGAVRLRPAAGRSTSKSAPTGTAMLAVMAFYSPASGEV